MNDECFSAGFRVGKVTYFMQRIFSSGVKNRISAAVPTVMSGTVNFKMPPITGKTEIADGRCREFHLPAQHHQSANLAS